MTITIMLKTGDALRVKCKEEEFNEKSLNRMFSAQYWMIEDLIIRIDEILYIKREADT